MYERARMGVGSSLEFLKGGFGLVFIGGNAVPSGDIVLHEGDAFTLNGTGDDHGRTIGGAVGFLKCGKALFDIVAIDFDHMPVEGGPFFRDGLDRLDIGDQAIELAEVPVEDGAEVIELEGGRVEGAFPDLALLAFAVTEHAEDAVVALIEFGGHGHADGDGEALAEGTCGCLDAGAAEPVRVALEGAAECAQGIEQCGIEVSGAGQGGVLDRDGVAFGEDEAVAVLPEGLFRVMPQVMKVEGDDHFDGGKAPAGMTASGFVEHLDDIDPHEAAEFFQLIDIGGWVAGATRRVLVSGAHSRMPSKNGGNRPQAAA